MDNETKNIVRKLAEQHLDFKSPVSVQRDYVQGENCYVFVSQDGSFKFHLLCTKDPKDLEATETLIQETLQEIGHEVSRKYLN